jgi:1,4-alpha-glucan branching enzyme
VRLSPLHGLAAAAACIALTLLGGQLVRSLTGADDRLAATARSDTVHVVRFVLIDPAALSVSLVGDFNAWEKGATRLSAGDNGAWIASIPLRAGRHEYAFIVEGPDGEEWVADPFARTVRDEFDTESSVIMVGNGTSRVAERSSS